MSVQAPSNDFFIAPTTVDFVFPDTQTFRDFIADKPYVVTTITLDGGYVLAYTDERNVESLVNDLGSFFRFSKPVVLGLL